MANNDKKKEEIPIVKDIYVIDFDKSEFMIDREVELKGGGVVKVKDYKKEFRKKGSIARGKLRTAEAFNVPLEHLEKAITDLNNRKVDGVFINDLVGRHGFYNGHILSRSDLARKISTSVSVVEVAVEKLKAIIKHIDYKGAYRDYLSILRAEKIRQEKEEIEGGAI